MQALERSLQENPEFQNVMDQLCGPFVYKDIMSQTVTQVVAEYESWMKTRCYDTLGNTVSQRERLERERPDDLRRYFLSEFSSLDNFFRVGTMSHACRRDSIPRQVQVSWVRGGGNSRSMIHSSKQKKQETQRALVRSSVFPSHLLFGSETRNFTFFETKVF